MVDGGDADVHDQVHTEFLGAIVREPFYAEVRKERGYGVVTRGCSYYSRTSFPLLSYM